MANTHTLLPTRCVTLATFLPLSKTQSETEGEDSSAAGEIKRADAGEPDRPETLAKLSAAILGTVDTIHTHTGWESKL